jgi:hypothetical protein
MSAVRVPRPSAVPLRHVVEPGQVLRAGTPGERRHLGTDPPEPKLVPDARDGRRSIPPERLLRALLLQAFYTVPSELQLMEQPKYNLLFRWFVGLSADDPVWDVTVFCKNRDRLLNGDIARKFMTTVLNLPEVRHPARRPSSVTWGI